MHSFFFKKCNPEAKIGASVFLLPLFYYIFCGDGGILRSISDAIKDIAAAATAAESDSREAEAFVRPVDDAAASFD